MMATLAEFIEQAWNDHVDDLAGVTSRLDQGLSLLDRFPEQLGDFLQLAEHVHLAHHGNPDALQAVLDRVTPVLAVQVDAKPFADRARLAMKLLRDEACGEPLLPTPAVVRAHGAAACGFIARGEFPKARRLLQSATSLARDAAVAIRTDAKKALAASCNNAATVLLDLPRSPEVDALMFEAAALSRSTWGEIGTWLNVERAEYLLALCASAVGDGPRAVEHAQLCESICETNSADAFEIFFAREAMAKPLLTSGDRHAADKDSQRMQALLMQIADEGQRAQASSTLDKLIALMKA